MIKEIEINNFRGFRKLTIGTCSPINVIVGDNGCGKTALLEAVFLTLCGHPERALFLLQNRSSFMQTLGASAPSLIESGLGEYFHGFDQIHGPTMVLKGTGRESRSLSVTRSGGDVRVPTEARSPDEKEIVSPFIFTWTDSEGQKESVGITFTPTGVMFQGTTQRNMPAASFIGAQVPVPPSTDTFGNLRRMGKQEEFVNLFKRVFPWIDDIFVDSSAGAAILSATANGQKVPLPLSAVSSAINRMATMLLAIAQAPKGAVLIDEAENGVFFENHSKFCKALLTFSRSYETQLFISTHSQEWLRAFINAAGKNVRDISLWRIERAEGQPQIKTFEGPLFRAAIERGSEVRRDQS